MNEHQELEQMLRSSGIDKRSVKQVWDTMREKGFAAAQQVLARLAEIAPVREAIRDYPLEFPVWGQNQIEAGAYEQMANAMTLPVSVAGALMADAHVGYGLPVGGVLATRDAIIPYAVGVDIGCQVNLTVFAESADYIDHHSDALHRILVDNTRFGVGCTWIDRPADHPILYDWRWEMTALLRSLYQTAQNQLGTSGGGNHFVEWVEVRANMFDNRPKIGLLSHSGSRGVGARIAEYYSKEAERLHPTLPDNLRRLAWLDMPSDFGKEYFAAMVLAGEFADANHAVIHERVKRASGLDAVYSIGTRHNLCWVEECNGEKVYVHRKGATPAFKGQIGLIPGTMADNGFIVEGLGNARSLNSASHGAGRTMGRKQALRVLDPKYTETYLREQNVTLIGGGLDESPQAYKSIADVMAAQDDLVRVVGSFRPRIVRMADDGTNED